MNHSTDAVSYHEWLDNHPRIKNSSSFALSYFLFPNYMFQWARVDIANSTFYDNYNYFWHEPSRVWTNFTSYRHNVYLTLIQIPPAKAQGLPCPAFLTNCLQIQRFPLLPWVQSFTITTHRTQEIDFMIVVLLEQKERYKSWPAKRRDTQGKVWDGPK